MKVNKDQFHFLSYLDISTNFSLPPNSGNLTFSRTCVTEFEKHVTSLCDKACRKIPLLARIFTYIPQTQKRLFVDVYLISQFGYCPLAWMKESRIFNKCINRSHKKALILVHSDFSSRFSELLEKDEL